MHVILTGLGSYGDVLPMIGLGTTLVRRGHRVTLVANPYFEEVVRSAGLTYVPIGTREDYLSLVHHPDLWHPTRGSEFVLRFGCEQVMRPLYELLTQHIVPGETVLAAHGLDMASRIAGEKLKVPVASIHFAPAVFMSTHQSVRLPRGLWGDRVPRWIKALQFWIGERFVLDPLMGPSINALRSELGLPPVKNILRKWWHATDAVVCMFPDWFAPPQPDWPPGVQLAGFPLWDTNPEEPLPQEVGEFLSAGPVPEETAPIVFMPGSANATAADFFAAGVEACVRLGRRGILLSKFPEQIPAKLPESVRHFDYVPLSQLLPRAAAFVHHGGIGSTAQGLAAGVPHLVRPMGFDQFDNSIRLQRLGVGAEVAVRDFRGPEVADALQTLIDSSDVAEKCQKMASECDGFAALEAACDALEKLGE